MNTIFIRGLWGSQPTDHDFNQIMNAWDVFNLLTDQQLSFLTFINQRILANIHHHLNITKEFPFPIQIYVYGITNYEMLRKLGFTKSELILVHEEPYIYHPTYLTESFWHKIDIFQHAIQHNKNKEIVFLDWDCYPTQTVDLNKFENIMHLDNKHDIQTCLQTYTRMKMNHRLTNHADDPFNSNRYTPNAGFIYLNTNNKQMLSFPQDIKKIMQNSKKNKNRGSWSEEVGIAQWIDKINKTWIGHKQYFQQHEPMTCQLGGRGSTFKRLKTNEQIFFFHNLKLHRNKIESQPLIDHITTFRH